MRSFEEGAFEHFVNKLKDNLGLKADKTYVDNKVKTDVPEDAKFTDTIATKTSVGLGNVDNVKQATKVEFDEHLAEKATQNEYGHIRLQDIPLPDVASKAEAEVGTNNTKMMTPLRTNQAIDSKFRWVDGLLEVNIDGVWRMFNEYIPEPDDSTNSPGSKHLISGTMEEGFFGEVSSSELITGDALASQVGISLGTSQHSTEPWLKFAYKGSIQFIAKKPIRNSISWNTINTAKCVYGDSGDKTVVIGGKTYKVTLMRATNPTNDPKTTTSESGGEINHYSEWNRLMCQIHEEAINGSWGYPNNIESDIGILDHSLGSGSQGMYSNADLIVASGDGRYSWCQEMSTSAPYRLSRGAPGVSNSVASVSSEASVADGWRPVLRLVEEV
ncbi:MAG TPA: hypothetical protein VFC79_14220 [Tissierellaceae bacterium]|nr:hypothetical protein [Tissierellaceae bacterium]